MHSQIEQKLFELSCLLQDHRDRDQGSSVLILRLTDKKGKTITVYRDGYIVPIDGALAGGPVFLVASEIAQQNATLATLLNK